MCRDALAMLKRQLPLLTIPDEPTDYPTAAASGWDWVELLHGYCIQNSIPHPKYTTYIHNNGYRHEVEVSGSSYFSRMKWYPTEWDSCKAAAHTALYIILVFGNDASRSSSGPFALKRADESLLAHVPRIPSHRSHVPINTTLSAMNQQMQSSYGDDLCTAPHSAPKTS